MKSKGNLWRRLEPIRWAAMGVAMASSVGCGTLESSHSLTGAPVAPFSGDVRIVMQGQQVPEGLDELAIVQAVGSGSKAEMPFVLERLKVEARAVGADGVVNVRIDQGSNTVSANGVAVRFR